MSERNLDTVRGAIDALNDRDIDRFLEHLDVEIRYESFFASVFQRGEYHGHDGIREYFRDLDEAWETIRVNPEQFLDIGEIVLVIGRLHYRGRASGAENDALAAWLWKLRDGKVVLFRAITEPERVLGSLGADESHG